MPVRIWDCVIVNDEIDLLHARMRVLDSSVHGFIVCEGDLTFTGRPKPLHFAENRERFREWKERIVYVRATLPVAAASAWEREGAQRDALAPAIAALDPDDLVLMADVDEFPPLELLETLAGELTTPAIFHMPHAIYFVDCLSPDTFRHIPTFRARDYTRMIELQRAPGGWGGADLVGGLHVSFLGGPEQIRRKVAAYSHQEYDLERVANLAHLERCLRYRAHFTGTVAMRVSPMSAWTSLQHALARELPGSVAGSEAVPRSRSEAFTGYARLRRTKRLPDRLVGWTDRHVEGLLRVAGPLLRAAYRLFRRLHLRRVS